MEVGDRVSDRPGSGLGLLRDETRSHYQSRQPLPAAIARRIDQPPLWLASTTRAVSPVHRAAPMDDIAIKSVDANGAVIGVHRFAYGVSAICTLLLYRNYFSDAGVFRAGLTGLPDEELLRLVDDATLVAALNCTRTGADPPTLAELTAARADR